MHKISYCCITTKLAKRKLKTKQFNDYLYKYTFHQQNNLLKFILIYNISACYFRLYFSIILLSVFSWVWIHNHVFIMWKSFFTGHYSVISWSQQKQNHCVFIVH